VFDDALPEEKFHQEEIRLGRSDAKTIAQLKESPLWETGDKFERDYPELPDTDKVSEIAAKLATGNAVTYGWHRTKNYEAEKAKFLETFATAIVNKNIDRIESIGIEAFRKEFERISNYANFEKINARTGSTAPADEQGSGGTRQDNRSAGAEDESRTETAESKGGEQISGNAATEVKKRSLPKTVSGAGILNEEDFSETGRFYETKRRDETARAAADHINEIDLQNAFMQATANAEIKRQMLSGRD